MNVPGSDEYHRKMCGRMLREVGQERWVVLCYGRLDTILLCRPTGIPERD